MDTSISIVQLNGTFEAFGMVMDFLAHTTPFSRFESGALADALLLQLRHGHHLVALNDRKVVGYAGWLLTSRAVGEAWMAGRGKLRPVRPDLADAASLTIVAATEKSAVPRLIRGARELLPGLKVYFKRDAGRTQPARKRTLTNTTGTR